MIKKFFIIIVFVLLQTNINASSFKPIIEGKKDAKIKLIIYESLTCSHCADFHNDVYPKLKKEFIDTGVINIEFRSFPLDMAALNASKLAHCNNDGKSDLLHFLYSNQKKHSDNSKNRKEQSVNRKSRKKFCTECGSPVELKDKYCSNCGAKI